MFTARELFDRSDWEYCKHYTDKRENWTLIKEPTKKKRKLTISGHKIYDPKLIDGVWRGKDYLIHFDEQHNLPNSWGGYGSATEKLEWLETYEGFIEKMDWLCQHIPGYNDDVEYQMTLF